MRGEGCDLLGVARRAANINVGGETDKCPAWDRSGQSNICRDKSDPAIREITASLSGEPGLRGHRQPHITLYISPCPLLKPIAGDLIWKLKSSSWS